MPHRFVRTLCASLAIAAVSIPAQAAPLLMSPQWAADFCQAWNHTPELATGLAGEWLHDDNGRGYKVIQLYRSDCGKGSLVELKIVPRDGQAACVYGGVPQSAADFGYDFEMHASTENWQAMGRGDPTPMWAMMSGKLAFQGPKMVAMRAMKPFASFLLLVGKVPSAAATCPGTATQAAD